MRKNYVYDIVLSAMFSIIITICAWITIPFAVPFTMQTFGIFFTIAMLGGKRATISILLYILIGIVGIPVFSGFQGGLGALFGNTGGYIIGFLLAALLIWGMEIFGRKCSSAVGKRKFFKRKTWMLAIQLITGLLVCYTFGTLWFWGLYMKNSGEISIVTILGICVVPFIIPDMLKIMLVLVVKKRLKNIDV